MKKLSVVLSGVLLSVSVYADKPLNVNPAYSMPNLEVDQEVVNTESAKLPEQDSYSKWSSGQTVVTSSSLYAHYTQQNGKFSNDVDVDLKGGTIGFSTTPNLSGWWAEFEYLKNNEYSADYYEATFGGHYNLINVNGFYTLATMGMGIGVGSADGFDDTAYLTLPIGLELGYSFVPNLSVFGGVGYKWNWEIKDDRTRCNDGTRSNSSGSGTCSWHGGIDDSSDYTIGDFDGLTYKAGIRYNF
ncbi:hypothetical protein HI850_007630 [bacterium SPL81]|nr:hypothetical protein [Acinetobacter baumannii]